MGSKPLFILAFASTFILVLVFQNCSQFHGTSQNGNKEILKVNELSKALEGQSQDQLLQLLAQETADQTCEMASECEAFPMGARPCGGPSQYVVAPSQKINRLLVLALIDQISKREAKQNEAEGLMGTCQFLRAPELACIDQRCAVVSDDH